MKRALLCSILLAAACGDDDGNADGATTSGTDDSTTGSPTSTADTTATVTTTASTTDGGSSGTETSSADTTTSSDTTTGDTSTGADTSSDDGSTTGDGLEACLPADIFAALDQHAHDLDATAGLLAGHPSAAEVTGFLLAPALPAPPALAAAFAGPLIMPCSEPLLYEEFCEEGRCSQIECTGSGASWVNHLWLSRPYEMDEWLFADVHVDLQWNEGATGTFVTISTKVTGPGGVVVGLSGEGMMDVESFAIMETFPELHVAGVTTMEYLHDGNGYSGTLSIAGVIVAEVDDAGHFVPTGDCP